MKIYELCLELQRGQVILAIIKEKGSWKIIIKWLIKESTRKTKENREIN